MHNLAFASQNLEGRTVVQHAVADDSLREMMAYYQTRAPEYDDWFYQRGRYNRGPAITERWFGEVGEVVDALERLSLHGEVLELAAGTGIWKAHLARTAHWVTALDASAAMLALNRAGGQRAGLLSPGGSLPVAARAPVRCRRLRLLALPRAPRAPRWLP
jgi:SAM-dependent methyltransferase